MAYERLDLKDGDRFKAAHVAHMEDGIKTLEQNLTNSEDWVFELEDGTSVTKRVVLSDA